MAKVENKSSVRFSNPSGLFDSSPYGYSQVSVMCSSHRLIAIAGQGGQSSDGTLSGDFRMQLRQAFSSLDIALRSVDATLADVMKQTILVVDYDEEKLGILVEELEIAYGSGAKPACTLMPVPRLAITGMLVEVDAWAALPV